MLIVAGIVSALVLVAAVVFWRELLVLGAGTCTVREVFAPYALVVGTTAAVVTPPGLVLLARSRPPAAEAVEVTPAKADGGGSAIVCVPSRSKFSAVFDPEPFTPGAVVRGQVVVREAAGTRPPVGATITVAGAATPVEADGSFEVRLLRAPRADEPVVVDAAGCVREVLRFDEFRLTAPRGVSVEPAVRLIVVEFEGVEGGRRSGAARAIRSGVEQVFTGCPEVTVVSGAGREKVIEVLYDFQQKGGLYSKASVPELGQLEGATHGLFGGLTAADPAGAVECHLVELRTGVKVKSASAPLAPGGRPADAAARAAASLLGELTRVRILAPGGDEQVGWLSTVTGSVRYLPPTGSLTVGVLPHRGNRLYPQKRVSLSRGDGSWIVPSVCIGLEGGAATGEAFEICAILADEAGTARIDAYLASRSNDGVDPEAAWPEARVKVLSRVRVTRPAAGGSAGVP